MSRTADAKFNLRDCNRKADFKKSKMADTSMRIPRRKNGARFHPKEAPFPVPIESITGKEPCSDRWYYYTGYFRDNGVVIEDLGDLTFLYKMVRQLFSDLTFFALLFVNVSSAFHLQTQVLQGDASWNKYAQ